MEFTFGTNQGKRSTAVHHRMAKVLGEEVYMRIKGQPMGDFAKTNVWVKKLATLMESQSFTKDDARRIFPYTKDLLSVQEAMEEHFPDINQKTAPFVELSSMKVVTIDKSNGEESDENIEAGESAIKEGKNSSKHYL